jgi:hypothetical protein
VTTRTPTAVADLEISTFVPPRVEVHHLDAAQIVLRLHGRPLAILPTPLRAGRLDIRRLRRDILASCGGTLAAPLLDRTLAIGSAPVWPEVAPMLACRPNTLQCTPAVTVAIRAVGNAPDGLRACLEAIGAADYPNVEVIVVDNDDAEAHIVDQAAGEVLVVLDAGVTIDRGWIGAAVRMLVADPEVAAVSGLVLPQETSTTLDDAILQRSWHRGAHVSVRPGAGAPFAGAFWRDALLGASYVESGFGEAFTSLLRAGRTVAYEPSALAWHRARMAANPFVEAGAILSRVAVRQVDLRRVLRSIADATDEDALRLDVSWDGRGIGQVDIAHHGAIVSPFRIQDAVGRALAFEVLDTKLGIGAAALRAILTSELAKHLLARGASAAMADTCPTWLESRPAAA